MKTLPAIAAIFVLASCAPPAPAPKGPPAAWQNVKPGMTRMDVEAITGDSPTKEGMVSIGGQDMEELVWDTPEGTLTVRGKGGVVETVDIVDKTKTP